MTFDAPRVGGVRSALVFTRYFEPAYRGGGPIRTLVALLDAKPEGYEVSVVCGNVDLGTSEPLVDESDSWLNRASGLVNYASEGFGPVVAAARSMRRKRSLSVIYANSFFDLRFSLIPQLLHRFGYWPKAVLVVAPRGELYEGALGLKPVRKRVFLAMYKMLGLHRRVSWHASSEDEAAEIRRVLGKASTVYVRENETQLPLAAPSRSVRVRGPLRLAFIGRAVPKKGLDILLSALRQVTSEVELTVIGPFEDARYEEHCRSLIAQLPPRISVDLRGARVREDVLAVLTEVDAMVFPTLGENFGHVIAEALSTACPVICSEFTPWTSRLEAGGGVVVAPNEALAWTMAIEKYAQSGEEGWSAASEAAAGVFGTWRGEDKGHHIFELVPALSSTDRGAK